MPRCFVALGGNLGSVENTFGLARAELGRLAEVGPGRMSSVHRFGPVGQNAGGEFRNAAIECETTLTPLDLLDRLQAIEDTLGRERSVRWGPRRLDLDLIFYGGQIIDCGRLSVPHPACWYRRFVLDPLAEIAADVVHPAKGVTVRELRERLRPRPLEIALAGAENHRRTVLIDNLTANFPEVAFSHWDGTREQMGSLPAIIGWLGSAGSRLSEQAAWSSLPIVPRLDLTAGGEAAEKFVVDVLDSALGR